MDQSLLSTRDVIGRYYLALERPSIAWMDGVSNLFNSDQASETYPFLGQVPKMREWIGGRQAKSLSQNSLTITNKHYENTMEIALKDLRRDKTGQLNVRISEFAGESDAHWGTLLIDLLEDAASTACYDGQYFFDTDHSEGASGSQSNDITVDISAVNAAVHGTTTDPSKEEMQHAIIKGISQILSFKDNQGRSMNTGARSFLVTVPMGLWIPAVAAITPAINNALEQNMNPTALAGFSIRIEPVPELTWTDSFAIWRQDSGIKGLIRQEETAAQVQVLGPDSEYAFTNKAIQIGVDAWRGAGYGMWQRSCYVTLV